MFAILGNILEIGKEIFRRRFQGLDICLDPLWFCFSSNIAGDEEITRWIEDGQGLGSSD